MCQLNDALPPSTLLDALSRAWDRWSHVQLDKQDNVHGQAVRDADVHLAVLLLMRSKIYLKFKQLCNVRRSDMH